MSSYPYSVPLKRGPGRPRTVSTEQSVIRGRHEQAEMGNFIWQPGPPDHIPVPQSPHREEIKTMVLDPFLRRPPILFQYRNAPTLGVALGSLLQTYVPDIVGMYDKVLDHGYREIKLRVLWPGYESFSKRVRTHSGFITRIDLLTDIAAFMMERIGQVKDSGVKVDPKHAQYALERFNPAMLCLTGLVHRGGSNWQLEVWVPQSQVGRER